MAGTLNPAGPQPARAYPDGRTLTYDSFDGRLASSPTGRPPVDRAASADALYEALFM